MSVIYKRWEGVRPMVLLYSYLISIYRKGIVGWNKTSDKIIGDIRCLKLSLAPLLHGQQP